MSTTPSKEAPIPEPSNTSVSIPITDSERHYTSLISFFHTLLGWTLASLGILGAVAAWMFFSNMREIREDAAKAATNEARRGVEEAFQETKIKRLTEEVASREINEAVKKQIAQQITEARKLMVDIGRVTDLGIRVRLGLSLESFDDLVNEVSTQSDPTIRQYAASTLSVITNDYERAYALYSGDTKEKRRLAAINYAGNSDDKTITDRDIIKKIYENFRKETDIQSKVWAVLHLREMTGEKFSIIDFQSVNAWAVREGLTVKP